MKFVPDFGVGPQRDVFVGLALDVEAADLSRTHAEEREATIVIGVNQLFRRWRGFGKNTEPAEWIFAVVNLQRARANRGAGDAVKTVATGDEIAGDRVLLAVKFELNSRS